ncbi:hypothetical protein D4764_10G0000090 [Takifugu flavidus]|uniref:Ig-like domain-containing protein n=1 Tax=Takifugu flavidus TaxID=433684 RepID=A0A5C6PJB9_9TELE|nr:hypothetical protein D4764_10G0000090 [Takifugu flavidus]
MFFFQQPQSPVCKVYLATQQPLSFLCVEAWQEVSWIGPVKAGFSTTFTCFSTCSPNCTYTWFLKNRTHTGSTLMWTPDGRDSKVDLRCTVLRMPEASLFSTITSIVEITNPISVQPSPQNTFPALNLSLDLECHDDSGSGLLSDPSQLVLWYKDGQEMMLDKQNGSLHFDSLLPSDGGFYQCEAFVSRQTSVFSRGYLLSFHETELKWTPSKPGTFQNLTCVAENVAAGRSAEATKVVEVKGTPLSGSEQVQLNGLLLISFLIVSFDLSRFHPVY